MRPQLAVAAALFGEDGIVSFNDETAEAAAEIFRSLGSPRRPAADVAVGAVALDAGAVLWTLNPRDFRDIPGIRFGP